MSDITISELVNFDSEENQEIIHGEMERMALQAEAKRRYAALENAGRYREINLTNEREIPPGASYMIEHLMPFSGYVLLTGQKKTGKTTLMMNLIKALTQREKFLGEFDVAERCRIALFDMEMDDRQHMRWLDSVGLLHERKLFTEYLRGEARALGIDDEDREEKLVERLSDLGIDVMIIDPIGPLLRAYGIDENSSGEVGRIIDRLVAIKEAAGIPGLIINHHQGKDGNLGARGSSVFEDTPDAIWKLTRDDRSKRTTLSAFGRDVDATRDLEYNPDTHVLSAVRASGTYLNIDNSKLILDALRGQGGLSGRGLFDQIKKVGYTGKLEKLNEDLRELEQRGEVINEGSKDRPKWVLS